MRKIGLLLLLIITSSLISAQVKNLEEFENKDGWSFIKSDGVNLKLSNEKGLTGNAVRFDYDFTKGTGYGGSRSFFPLICLIIMNLPFI